MRTGAAVSPQGPRAPDTQALCTMSPHLRHLPPEQPPAPRGGEAPMDLLRGLLSLFILLTSSPPAPQAHSTLCGPCPAREKGRRVSPLPPPLEACSPGESPPPPPQQEGEGPPSGPPWGRPGSLPLSPAPVLPIQGWDPGCSPLSILWPSCLCVWACVYMCPPSRSGSAPGHRGRCCVCWGEGGVLLFGATLVSLPLGQ